MVKLWAKVLKDNKIIANVTVVDHIEKMDYSLFYDYVHAICEKLDIPTPVILKTHIFNYAKFNFVKFVPSDFVESVSFDSLWLENGNKSNS